MLLDQDGSTTCLEVVVRILHDPLRHVIVPLLCLIYNIFALLESRFVKPWLIVGLLNVLSLSLYRSSHILCVRRTHCRS